MCCRFMSRTLITQNPLLGFCSSSGYRWAHMGELGQSAVPQTKVENRNLLPLALIIVFGIFASTMPQPQALGKLPLQFLLKNDVHVTREQMATFFFWCRLAWYLKPFAGILTDAFPFFGTRRRHYLLFSSVLTALSWIGMGFLPHTYGALLWGSMAVNLFMVMASTVTGAFLVEAGQRMGATGRLTALRMFVSNFCTLIQGPLGGLLATAGFMWATGANAALALTIFPIAYILLEGAAGRSTGTQRRFSSAGHQLKTIIRSKNLWMALCSSPCIISRPDFQRRFSTSRPMSCISPSRRSEISASSEAVRNSGDDSLRPAYQARPYSHPAIGSIATAAAGTLFYLFYSTWIRALLIESQSGFFVGLAELTILDLAARATPKGCEGLGYSLMLSIRNVAASGADVVGSYLADHNWPFAHLVYLSAGTTAIVLILLPLLPAALMRSKDAALSKGNSDESPSGD